MKVILLIIAYLFLLIWPVRFAARAVGARRDSISMCFFAIIIVGFANNLMSNMDLGDQTITAVGVFIAFFVVSGFIYMFMLETTFKGGVVITVVQVVLTLVLSLGFAFLLEVLFPGSVASLVNGNVHYLPG